MNSRSAQTWDIFKHKLPLTASKFARKHIYLLIWVVIEFYWWVYRHWSNFTITNLDHFQNKIKIITYSIRFSLTQ